jgi:hypothetical protein
MNSGATNEQVIQSFLHDFQHELRGFRGLFARLLFPRAPSEGYVQQFSKTNERGRMGGEVVRLWRVTASSVEELPTSFQIPERVRRSRRFYPFAAFALCLPEDSGIGVVSTCLGPLWGHGRRFSIVREAGGWRIEWKGGWKS